MITKIINKIMHFFACDECEELREENKRLNEELRKQDEEKDIEFYLNNRHPKIDKIYSGRWFLGKKLGIDVRNFLTVYDSEVKKATKEAIGEDFKNVSDDEKALRCLKWVIKNIKYVPDIKSTKKKEFWFFPFETLYLNGGDCDDGCNLLHTMMLISGIPYWKIRTVAGDTPFGGHAYIVYYYQDGNRWVALDWCYFQNEKKISEREDYKENQLYRDIWFSFNLKYCFADTDKNLGRFK